MKSIISRTILTLPLYTHETLVLYKENFLQLISKEENIGNIGNIDSLKTRKYRWKYRDNIDIDKNYMETTEIVRKTWKFFNETLQDVYLVNYLLVYHKKLKGNVLHDGFN